MNRLISLEPSNVVAIRIESGQKCSGQLTLRNVMYTMPVAFRIQPTLKTRYSVKPQSGLIAPLEKVTVEIVYYLLPGATLPENFPNSDDSFHLHSVVVPGAEVKPFDSVPADWFTAKKKQVFTDSGIKIMFVGSPILAQLVTDGAMDDVREVLEKSDPSWEAADSVDSDGQTLIHLAISQGRPDLVQLILEFGPDLEAQSPSGYSPLEAACGSGEALITELLLARKVSTERSENSALGPIHLAARAGHVDVLRLLILKGSKVNALTRDGVTALHLAVGGRRRDCARLLLAGGAHVNACDDVDGDTPLHVAAGLGDESMVKLLLQKGANKDVRNHGGRTPYEVAAENGHSRLFDALRLGDSLCSAARKGDVRTILRLLENGAAVNGRDQNGWTPLHRASFKGWAEAARALLEKGAEVNAKDDGGYTPLHCAAESGHVDVVELLVKRGADVDARTNKGATALHFAESSGYIGVARILVVDRRADVSKSTVEDFRDQKDKKRVRGRVVRGGGGGFGRSMALAVV